MENELTIRELSKTVLEELEKLNYRYNSICQFRAAFNRVIVYADNLSINYFSEELGRKYLAEKHNCEVNYYQETFPEKAKHAIRVIRLLGDYQIHGVIIRRIVKKKDYVKPPQFADALDAYEKECEENQYSLRGMRTRLQRLFFLIDYLSLRDLKSFRELTPKIISDYVKTICPHHEKSIASILTTMRMFLRFLYLNEYTDIDLSMSVPKQIKYYYPPVPSIWNADDVRRMLNSIDRGNPAGKRDYAILILVAKLGIRVGDIKSMKLSDLDWKRLEISIIQQKTKTRSTFPILNDIGWALIDYLKNGRPESCVSECLFVRLRAPYEAFGKDANLHNIITKHTREADINIPKENRRGLHSLRHALASTLLANGTPLPIITDVLGHIDPKSTAVYLRTDMSGLKKCALDPDEVLQ